jgi:hypothetical protein
MTTPLPDGYREDRPGCHDCPDSYRAITRGPHANCKHRTGLVRFWGICPHHPQYPGPAETFVRVPGWGREES